MRRALVSICALAGLLVAAQGAGLAQVNLAAGRPATASSSYPNRSPDRAVDSDTMTTTWNSGNYGPSWIEVDLGAEYPIGTVIGKEAMTPSGQISHTATGRTAAGATHPLGGFSGSSASYVLIKMVSADHTPVRYVRVTSSSPVAWIAWLDLRVYASDETVPVAPTSWGRIKSLYR